MRMRGFLVACLVGVSVVMAALALSCSVALAGVVPAVEDEWALNVSWTGVELHASIDPNGLQTTYHFGSAPATARAPTAKASPPATHRQGLKTPR